MRLICDTAASCACKIGRSASPATGAGPGATTSARGDHLRERRTGPRRAWRSELPFGCLRIVPQVVRQLADAQSHQPISQYFESRKRPVCDRALQQQSVLVVGQELQALELVSFDRALPSIVAPPLDYDHAPMGAKKIKNFPAGDRELNSGFSASQPDQARCAQSRSRPSSLER